MFSAVDQALPVGVISFEMSNGGVIEVSVPLSHSYHLHQLAD